MADQEQRRPDLTIEQRLQFYQAYYKWLKEEQSTAHALKAPENGTWLLAYPNNFGRVREAFMAWYATKRLLGETPWK